MTNVPASPCSAGPALHRGRELTADEERLFTRRRRAGLALLVVLMTMAPALACALAWGATRPSVDVRVRTFASGAKEVESEFVGAVREGRYTEYHPNGVVKALGSYTRNLEDGAWEYFYYSGVRQAEGQFSRGLHDGAWRQWYSDGGLKAERFFAKGVREGVWRSYYPSGQLQSEQPYEKGSVHGQERVFYEDGELASDVGYRAGQRVGLYRR
jgi:antitoxin component YwqK of YwqJK toxin-antitoxin module